jgi:hypothetical protein
MARGLDAAIDRVAQAAGPERQLSFGIRLWASECSQ